MGPAQRHAASIAHSLPPRLRRRDGAEVVDCQTRASGSLNDHWQYFRHQAPTPVGHGGDYADALQRRLERGFRSMRFEPSLEAAYRDEQFRDSLKDLRISLALLMALVFAIVQVDRVVIPQVSETVPNVVRLGVMVFILVSAFALTFGRHASLWYPRIMTALMTVGMMGIGWIGLIAWTRLGEDRMFVRLVIATIAVYFIMGLRFRLALGANLVLIAFYVAAGRWVELPPMVMAQFLAMLLMTSVICAVGAYNLERARRIAWLEGQLLSEIALRDGLTGINNRRRLDQHLQQIWQHGLRERKPVAVLFADIDCFKLYNDHYGHQAGDEALKMVASVLARFGRRPLDMAARFGGEEFAVVLYDTDPEVALRIGEDIREQVRALNLPHAGSSAAAVLTVSVGIASLVPTAKRSCAGLLALADQALYSAKDTGRDNARLLAVEPDVSPDLNRATPA